MRGIHWNAALLFGLTAAAVAEAPGDWVPVPDSQLEQVRGGFDTGNGLAVSLGVERIVAINGQVVASSSFEIADVGRMSAAEAEATRAALQQVHLVQNGSGNIAPESGTPIAAALLIQNTANEQLIRSQTTINTSVNSLIALKLMNIEATLRQALANVTAPR